MTAPQLAPGSSWAANWAWAARESVVKLARATAQPKKPRPSPSSTSSSSNVSSALPNEL